MFSQPKFSRPLKKRPEEAKKVEFKKAVDEPNPLLKVEHPHNWLSANDGKELVCGDCSLRRSVL